MITPDNQNCFKSASYIYGKVKRFLSSYDAANLIDEGEFPTYIAHVLNMLGIGVRKEEDAIVRVKDNKAKLPCDFKQLYSAFKCSPFITSNDVDHLQSGGIHVYNDITWELLKGGDNAEIAVVNVDDRILESIKVRQYVRETAVDFGFNNAIMLQLSPNVNREKCADNCLNFGCSSPYEISIKNGMLYTNFSEDSVYLKYYSFPIDESGVPLIPDIEEVERAIEWCIIYELLMTWWMNGQVPNIENRWQYAKSQYDFWMAEAKYQLKLPSFLQMVNKSRLDRINNKVMLFAR